MNFKKIFYNKKNKNKMETKNLKNRLNIAPSSTEGHYVKGAKNIVNLDDINETYFVEGASVLETKNHTSLKMDEDCLITCQVVYNPFSEMYQKSQD